MTQDTNLSKETEQFSFIRTITIEPYRENEGQDENFSNPKSELGFTKVQSDRNSEDSSVLSIQKNNYNSPITISNSWYSWDTWHHNNNNLATVIVLPESATKKQFSKPDFNYYLDRILLIFAGGYLCFIFWWLCLAKNAMFPLTFLWKQEENISRADADFIDYMQQSLEIIDSQVTKTKILSEKETSEVGYVPVYTPSSNTYTGNSHQTINPSLPSSQSNTLQNKDVSLPLLPPPPPLNRLAMNPPISAIPLKPPAPPLESVQIKTTPAKTVKSTPQTVVSPEIAATNIKPNLDRVLVGVMELNESSAALFKINGVTQRIWLGERIESTGWVLKSVANQKAIISREGKSLTINVGENF